VATITYGNGAKTLYTYNHAGWVTAIRHEKAEQSLILLLGYGYSPDGLITSISESGGPGGWATTTFTYDNRNRLIQEFRDGLGLYAFAYTYDQGGNRLTKTDDFNSRLTTYHYDLEDTQYYQSKNNRLMYYEVHNITVPETPVLMEKVYYEYQGEGPSKGHPTRVVYATMDPVTHQPAAYAAADLTYNHQGELWFVTQEHWAADDVFCDYRARDRITEFRGNGRARYMARQRNPYLDEYGGSEWQVLPETAVWSDYDGDVIYGDYVVDPNEGTIVERTAYLPAIGEMDSATGAVTYYHADHLGTLRATTDGAGLVSSRLILTAFGETVAVDGTVSTRYQYAGEWGYESALGAPGHGGAPGQSALPWQHVGHRWYEPSTGRFLQRDPIGILGGLNVYAYAGSTPSLRVDPMGLDSWLTDLGKGFQSAGNIVVGAGCAITLYGILTAGPPTAGASIPPAVALGGLTATVGGISIGIGEILIQLDRLQPPEHRGPEHWRDPPWRDM